MLTGTSDVYLALVCSAGAGNGLVLLACENGSWRIVPWRWPRTVVGSTICWWHTCVLYNTGTIREQLQDGGLDFGGGGGIPLLDLQFADDILLFATSPVEAARMVDALVTCLKEVGLALKASKAKILTTQAQPGKTVTTQNDWKWKCWMRLRRTNGLDVCCEHWTVATKKLTWPSVCRLHWHWIWKSFWLLTLLLNVKKR